MIPLWVVIVGTMVFAGMFIREIMINNKMKEEMDLLARSLGYMKIRFDYSPTWEDITFGTGIEDKLEKLIKEDEEK